jgi:hypothetical protein
VRRPCAAKQAAGNAHRVYAGITGPVGQRRSVQDNRAGKTFAIGRKQSDGPSRLTVSVKDWRRSGMACRHFPDKSAQRMEHVGDSLPRTRLWKKGDEIDWISLVHGNADFRVSFEAADARALTNGLLRRKDKDLARIDPVGIADLLPVRPVNDCVASARAICDAA